MSTNNSLTLAKAGSWIFVAEWNLNSGKKVCLFQGSDSLAFSVDGREGKKTLFSTQFDPHYTANLVKMFKRTIATNLEEATPDSSSFIPLLFTDLALR